MYPDDDHVGLDPLLHPGPWTDRPGPFVLAVGDCWACGRTFTFNPYRVPSIQGDPVCESCMRAANVARAERGEPPHTWPADAYAPTPDRGS